LNEFRACFRFLIVPLYGLVFRVIALGFSIHTRVARLWVCRCARFVSRICLRTPATPRFRFFQPKVIFWPRPPSNAAGCAGVVDFPAPFYLSAGRGL